MNSCLHNLRHLSNDQLLVGALGVAGCLDLSLSSLGESNGEKSDNETISGLGLDGSLDEGVPLLDHGASLISGDVHTIELSVAVKALDFLNLELELSERIRFGVVVAISEVDADNTTLQTIRGLFLTSRLVAWSQCDVSSVKTWGKDVVPFLLDEWVSAENNQTVSRALKHSQTSGASKWSV